MYKSLCMVVLLLSVALLSSVKANDDGTPHYPTIVAEKAFLQVTGPITQDLYTPTRDGNFRIQVYQGQQGPASALPPTIQMKWTDEFGTYGPPQGGFPMIQFSPANQSYCAGGALFVHAFPVNQFSS